MYDFVKYLKSQTPYLQSKQAKPIDNQFIKYKFIF